MTTTSFFLSAVLQHSLARRTRIYTCSSNFGDCAYSNKKSRSSILQPLAPTPLGAPLRLAAQRVATASPHTLHTPHIPTPTRLLPTTQQETLPLPPTSTTSWTTLVQHLQLLQHHGVPTPHAPCEPQYFLPFPVGPRVFSPYLGLPPQTPCRLLSGPNSQSISRGFP